MIDTIYSESAYQLNNLWEFFIEDKSDNEWPLRACVKEASLLFNKLTTETSSVGEKYFSDIEYIGEFALTFRERTDFSTYTYFKSWLDEIYDEEAGTFLSSPSGTEKGSANDLVHRKSILLFSSFEEDVKTTIDIVVQEVTKHMKGLQINRKEISNLVYENIGRKEMDNSGMNIIQYQEIIQNILLAIGRQAAGYAVEKAQQIIDLAHRFSPKPGKVFLTLPPPPTRKWLELIARPFDYRSTSERIYVSSEEKKDSISIDAITDKIKEATLEKVGYKTWKEITTKKFIFTNLKITGIDTVSLDYTSGEPLEYTVNFIADTIKSN